MRPDASAKAMTAHPDDETPFASGFATTARTAATAGAKVSCIPTTERLLCQS